VLMDVSPNHPSFQPIFAVSRQNRRWMVDQRMVAVHERHVPQEVDLQRKTIDQGILVHTLYEDFLPINAIS
jgi:hypothetical protein